MSGAAGGVDVQDLYARRFADTLAFRQQMWDVLCRGVSGLRSTAYFRAAPMWLMNSQ